MKAEKIEAEKKKAAEVKAEEKKKAEMTADKKKADQENKDKTEPKVLSNDEKITRLERSLKRQINRANKATANDLSKKLVQLETDGGFR